MEKVNPKVPITLDKERVLWLNLNAMIAFQEVTGKSPFESEAWKDQDIKTTRALLWACLIHEDKELTLEDVGNLIDLSNINEVMDKLIQAWGLAVPEQGNARPLA